MYRLMALLYVLIGTTMAGSLMVAALAAGLNTTVPVVVSAAVGFALGLPVSYLVARALYNA